MEENLAVPPVMAKRIWSIVRVILFMVRKGLPKTNPMLHLNMLFKRGKIAGSKAIANLIYHHHSSSSLAAAVAAASSGIPRDYEFSCTNTPAYTFTASLQPPNIKIKLKNHFLACAGAQTVNEDEEDAISSNNDCQVKEMMTASPVLPGFGRLTPLVRPLRITDSPFPLRDVEDEDNGYVDKAAEEFIQRFYKELKLQKRLTDISN
ncbi:uncharacterized protein LOC110810167 [Carica papaya]|uniref:uncharacterized protein LOC110810167 n=1 Tax=Carica papaya TaxID=3649 RepID=UPI000B8CF9EB|nr:uncharacterized protein LOC110810167 [Carica papaya]